eukprot:6236325-Amphidinium_carterae.2
MSAGEEDDLNCAHGGSGTEDRASFLSTGKSLQRLGHGREVQSLQVARTAESIVALNRGD